MARVSCCALTLVQYAQGSEEGVDQPFERGIVCPQKNGMACDNAGTATGTHMFGCGNVCAQAKAARPLVPRSWAFAVCIGAVRKLV